jgi:acyl carrier protein
VSVVGGDSAHPRSLVPRRFQAELNNSYNFNLWDPNVLLSLFLWTTDINYHTDYFTMMFQKTLVALMAVGVSAFAPQHAAFVGRRAGPSTALFSVEAKVMEIIVSQLGVDAAKVVPLATFVDDLGADSLDTVELIMAIEEEFDCEIPEEEAANISTVQDVIGYVSKLPVK